MLPLETLKEIQEIYAHCRRTYPTIDLPLELFHARLQGIVEVLHPQHAAAQKAHQSTAGGETCAECLTLCRHIHHDDLYLAMACARGNRIAWEYFADQYLPQLNRFAAQACKNFDAGEDLAQELVVALLGENAPATQRSESVNQLEPNIEENRGKLQSYTGRGSLSGWLRAALAHAAIDHFRRTRKQVSLEELSERGEVPRADNPGPTNDSEERLDSHWGPVLIRCVHQEISRLSARDRLLLRLYHLEGIPLKSIGSRYGVHEATISRWLEHARREVRKHVEHNLRKMHGLSAREVGSLWRWALETANPMLESALRPEPARVQVQKKLQGGTI